MDGVIIKAYGGFYFVWLGGQVYPCAIRGKVRHLRGNVLVGDRVQVTLMSDGEAVIEDILPRSAELVRPPIANVDQAVIVFALSSPEPNTLLLDRFLVCAHVAGVTPVICFNKCDLMIDKFDLAGVYEKAGLSVHWVSAITGAGITELNEILQGRISVFAGPSGVGKSSLLNVLQPGLALKTGEISNKLKRGKHTTRHVELIPLTKGGLVADTPGFSNLYLQSMPREELSTYFSEFAPFVEQCRFSGCLHYREPNCAVKEAVDYNAIPELRYRHYVVLLEEIIAGEKRGKRWNPT